MFNKPKMDRAKDVMKDEGKGKSKATNSESSGNKIGKGDPVEQKAAETPTVLDDYKDSKENGSKRVILQILSDVADLHERVKKCAECPVFLFAFATTKYILFVVSLYGADQNPPINMAGYVLSPRCRISVPYPFIGSIVPLPCDTTVASKVYRKALIRRWRHFILACHAGNSCNTCRGSCSVNHHVSVGSMLPINMFS